ncbi:lysylphosphatidylglycerol synthase transmembrane domain-containing protein [Anaerobaca lacustris]|uniref:Lysylphosphatidylglycerol synthase transmembrane domain-containing protein n=1 Tax=Anaerobaca lacustris TaxID=3044600 RepID=A0AAW6TWF4_9BACT|nr:lysylphosphatidylglycerol synthase transmembrane domain-containing protein [Sedimentisphaerales bacterium M17dextr]
MPEAQDARRTRHGSLVARIVVATVAIVWVFRGQDWEKLREVLGRLSWAYFALGLAAYIVGQIVVAFRWWLLLRAQSIHIEVLAAVRLYFVGLFYNNVMPSSVGGDLLKAYYVTKHTHRRLEGVLSVAIDRLVGLSGMVLMAVAAYLLFVRGRAIEAPAEQAEGVQQGIAASRGAIFFLFAVLAAATAAVLVHPGLRGRFRRIAGRLRDRGAELFGRFRTALAVYCRKPVTMLAALLLTVAGQSIVVSAFWLLGRNLGIEAGPRYYFVIFPVTWVVAAIPVSIAGLGVLEMGIVTLFVSLAGTTGEAALALAFCQRFVWVLASLPGGMVHLLGGHLPRQFLVDGENGAN